MEKYPTFEIRVGKVLNPDWSEWFDGLQITPKEDGTTLLTGPVIDDAALHGLLKKARDLGLPLLSVNRIKMDPSDSFYSEEENI